MLSPMPGLAAVGVPGTVAVGPRAAGMELGKRCSPELRIAADGWLGRWFQNCYEILADYQ